jgi:3-deoxy-D-manno-octulosonic-acid transferase
MFKPKIAIFMEKEIWPTLYGQCFQNNIPVTIINARLSANSAKGYKKISGLVKPILTSVSKITAQTEEDKQRFIEVGAKPEILEVLGNLKFDIKSDTQIIQQAKDLKGKLFSGRYVWIIASTHKGEEELFFELYVQLKKKIPELLLLVVPRHPERFVDVRTLAEKNQLSVCMRSSTQLCEAETDVYIADTMGELKLLYGVADISFVGGSMVPVGGHNILEPAAMNVPVTFGPYMVNSKHIAREVVSLGAAIQCKDKIDVMDAVLHLYQSPEDQVEMVAKMSMFLKDNQGATERTRESISKLLVGSAQG